MPSRVCSAFSSSRIFTRRKGSSADKRLVEQQHLRIGDQGARQRHALLLAAGELGRQTAGEGLHLHALQHVERLGAALLLVDAAHAQAEGDVVGAIEMRKQGVALEHHRRAARRRRQIGDVLGSQDDVAFARLLVAGDHAQGRGLAAAARAQQAAIGARRDAQADRVHRRGLAKALGHGHQFNVGLRCHRASGKQAPCHYCKIDRGIESLLGARHFAAAHTQRRLRRSGALPAMS